jgi:hypothetical protein
MYLLAQQLSSKPTEQNLMKSGIGIEGRKEEVYTKKLSGKLEID